MLDSDQNFEQLIRQLVNYNKIINKITDYTNPEPELRLELEEILEWPDLCFDETAK